MRENLEPSLQLVFGSEGGFWDDPAGGPTKFGITQRTLAAHRGHAVTRADVREMELDEAAVIYRTGYWTQSGGDLLPAGVDYAAFDFGVNSGPAQAVKVLQRVLKVKADGNVGPQTVAAAQSYPGGAAQLVVDYGAARMAFLKGLKNWKENARGWTSRVDKVILEGRRMARGDVPSLPAGTVPQTPPVASPKAMPTPVNPWTQPDVVLAAGSALGGLSFLFQGEGPVQIAVAVAIAVAAVVVGIRFVMKARAE